MAFLPTDPASAHSLWLQLRSSGRLKSRRHRWRDWTPLLVLILLTAILAFGYLIILPNNRFESAEQAAQNETVLKDPPVLGVMAGQTP
jgi:hypothetical protein